MAYSTINKSTDYFNTKLYTGNGGTQALTGVGHQPDMVWVKSRGDSDGHKLFDAVRGALKVIEPNDNSTESTYANSLTSFDSDGFTVGSTADMNDSGDTFASWNWKAGTTGSGSTTGSGTYKAYSYSVNTTAGFSIVKYKGNGTTGHTIPHHLGVAPAMFIIKRLDSAVSWYVYHHKASYSGSASNDTELYLDTTDRAYANSKWNATSPTSTVFTINNSTAVNGNDNDYIAYCFAEKTGYSKFGSYTGNGSTDGPFIYTGFKPAFVITKRTDGTGSWGINDNRRPGYNVTHQYLLANDAQAEATDGSWSMDLLSNGWKARYNNGNFNASGGSYIYMAFGQSLVGSNNVPCTAR